MAKKIGLIEDDATMVSLLQTLFRLEGYEPSIYAPTSIEGVVQNVVEEHPAALLVDVHLKSFNGIDLTQTLRKVETIPQPLIVMASGMNLAKECEQAGADHFFLKPYMPDDLITWLKNNL